jgi:hypothetical protein
MMDSGSELSSAIKNDGQLDAMLVTASLSGLFDTRLCP